MVNGAMAMVNIGVEVVAAGEGEGKAGNGEVRDTHIQIIYTTKRMMHRLGSARVSWWAASFVGNVGALVM